MLFLHADTSHRLVVKRKLIQTFCYRSPEQTALQQVIASFRKFYTSLADDTIVSTSKILISPGALQQQKGKKKIPKAMIQVVQTVPLPHQIQGG